MARDLCCVSACVLGWSLSFSQSVIGPLCSSFRRLSGRPGQVGYIAPNLAQHVTCQPHEVYVSIETISLWRLSACSWFTPKNQSCAQLQIWWLWDSSPAKKKKTKLLICCDIGKSFALNHGILTLWKIGECCWNRIGVVFFHCRVLTEKHPVSTILMLSPPTLDPLSMICNYYNHCVCVSFLSKRILKLEAWIPRPL